MDGPEFNHYVYVLVEVGDTNDGAEYMCHEVFEDFGRAQGRMRMLYDKAIRNLQNDVQIDNDASYFSANVALITTDDTPPECWSWHILESFIR